MIRPLLLLFSLIITNSVIFSQWSLTSGVGSANVWVLKNLNSAIYAGTQSSAYVTTDNGDSWQQINNGLPVTPNVKDFAANGSTTYCAIYPENKLYSTTNSGQNWIPTSNYPSNYYTQSVALSGSYLFAGCDQMVVSSTNGGNTWSQMNSGSFARNVTSLVVTGSVVYAGTSSYGVYFSFLNGNSWTHISGALGTAITYEMAYGNNTLYVACNRGIQSTTNNGANWVQLNSALANTQVPALSLLGTNIFISAQNKVHFTSNNGANWQDITAGLPSNPNVLSLAYNDTYIFAGLSTGAVYRLLLSSVIGIEPISSNLPAEFSLKQNYPNPFNPETTFRFDIEQAGFVKLRVIDAAGREVSTLVNSQLRGGEYEYKWNASNLPSGVYFYTLDFHETGSGSLTFTETRKMVLMK